ncbi:MAG: TetR/AcrR family transcriptional regulator [Puniceicoccales bacterium]|jgi:AcrR family transcriptional regulator|nr:TetR/AcrR family transcriptional regulator [Puniceicoccales bacterium]
MQPARKKRGKGRSNVQGEKRRANILKVSVRLFALRGYDNVSLRDIADEIGITPSLIMHHFGSKTVLYREAVDHLLQNGEVFMRGVIPILKVDPSDKPAVANAIAESIHIFFDMWYGPNRTKYLDRLMLQVIFSSGAVDIPLALKWIRSAEKILEDLFIKLNPDRGVMGSDVRAEIFFSHIFYPAVICKFLLSEHSWKDYPVSFLLEWKKNIARDFCLGLGLPLPSFIYPDDEPAAPSPLLPG